MRKLIIAILLTVGLFSCKKQICKEFSSQFLTIGIDKTGRIVQLTDSPKGINYCTDALGSPLLTIVDDGELKEPVSFIQDQNNLYNLEYENSNTSIKLIIDAKQSHILFEIFRVTNPKSLEAVIWGPYAVSIKDTIGENIGVVRNKDFAIGIQSLNPKTTAGKLDNIQGIVDYWGTAAEETDNGAILQAFAINRTRDLTNSKWDGWENRYEGRPINILNEEEGAVTGSAIVLFGCTPQLVLDNIGQIEIAEGLPHPKIEGVWVKKSKENGRAYVISPFTEQNIDRTIEYVKQAGLRSIYHEGPFETWGHFKLDTTMFPNEKEGFVACVEKVKEAGLFTGVHTLTNFITPNDKFVTPIPDKRLATTGKATLLEDLDLNDTEVQLSDIGMLKIQNKNWLNTIRIGNELIQYASFSEQEPYILYNCKRGAHGTSPSEHFDGDTVVNLLDFAYRIFYPDWGMQKDLVKNLTGFLNETGVAQMAFDGHEGCYASGQGDYAMDKFALDWYNQLDHIVVNSSSRLKHFYWHINHYINWGEPWYGGFRESEADRRFKVQPFLERNYLKNMLGWFMIKSNTTPEEIEWMMARAAGYNAGFALVLRMHEIENNPHASELMHLIKIWEEARLEGAFDKEQMERLRDPNNEFHLEMLDENKLVLYSYKKNSFTHVKKVLQPGEPTDSEWEFQNETTEQPLQFRITLKGEEGIITKPELEFNRSYMFKLPDELAAGSTIVSDGSEQLRIYDSKGRFVKNFNMEQTPPALRKGKHVIRFNCQFEGEDNNEVVVVVKQRGSKEEIEK